MDKRPAIDPETVREQVGRILRSPEFAASPRLGEFLTFVTEQHLSGRGDTIKEYVIGLEVYRKRDGYDPRIDPTVRVDAGKLRARLAKYYQNGGSGDPIRIEIPKGSYIPKFEWATSQGGSLAVSWWRPSRWLLASGIATLIALAGAALLARHPHETLPPILRTLSLTSISGEQYDPSLSPDGSMLAFSWNGEQRNNFDIYVKMIDAPHAVRLTTNPAPDIAPRWSPDGQRIAFIRNPGPGGQVIVIPALGGEEHVAGLTDAKSVYWTADGGSLLVSRRPAAGKAWAGYMISLESSASRQITFPPEDAANGDYDLIPSPDGLTVAFCRMVYHPQAEIWLLDLRSGKSRPVGSDVQLAGLAWTPSGRDIVFSSRKSGMSSLWIMAATGGEPAPLGGTALNATRPSVAPRSPGLDRIAYQRVQRPANLFSLDLSSAAPARKIAGSDRVTTMPQFSPDEKRIAFASDRSGHFSVWVARADGAEARDITGGQQIWAGAPRWSPDGARIAFDAHGNAGESSDIYVIDANGYASPRRLSPPGGDRVRPAWSADGRWVYFSSSQSGSRQIWRMPADGGAATQMTRNGGFDCFESADGRDLYFTKGSSAVGLWRIPVAGGPEEAICPLVRQARWGLTAHGIAFQDADQRLSILDLPSGRVARFAPAGQWGDASFGLTITRDGRRAIYSQSEAASSELIMLEGRLFR